MTNILGTIAAGLSPIDSCRTGDLEDVGDPEIEPDGETDRVGISEPEGEIGWQREAVDVIWPLNPGPQRLLQRILRSKRRMI